MRSLATGSPCQTCHGASTTPNEGLPNSPGEPQLAHCFPTCSGHSLHPSNFKWLLQVAFNMNIREHGSPCTGCSATARSRKRSDALVASASHQVVSQTKTSLDQPQPADYATSGDQLLHLGAPNMLLLQEFVCLICGRLFAKTYEGRLLAGYAVPTY